MNYRNRCRETKGLWIWYRNLLNLISGNAFVETSSFYSILPNCQGGTNVEMDGECSVWSCLLNAPALFLIGKTTFRIKRVTWWDFVSSYVTIFGMIVGLQDLKHCCKWLTNLTKSFTWCVMRFLWWQIKQEHWEGNFTLNTSHCIPTISLVSTECRHMCIQIKTFEFITMDLHEMITGQGCFTQQTTSFL